MSHYFLCGNLWAAFAVLAIVGRNRVRTHPTMYSFFSIGQLFEPSQYFFFVAFLIAAALGCFVLHYRSCLNDDYRRSGTV